MSNYTINDKISLLDGVRFVDFNAKIESISGFLDDPEPKENYKHSWPDEHGLDIDLSKVYYSERKCQIDFIVKGTNYIDLVSNINALKKALRKPGYRYLKLYGIIGVYLIVPTGIMPVVRLNRGVDNTQYARMSVTFIEPYPVKFMYYADQSIKAPVSLNITTAKPLTIDWGDNTYSLASASGTKSHNYTEEGDYCIIVYGGIDSTTVIEPSNCIELIVIAGGGETSPEPPDDTPITVDSTTTTADDTTITSDNQ